MRRWWEGAAVRAAIVGAWMGTAVAQPAGAPPTAEQGRRLYASYCARCHGIDMVSPGSAFFDLRTLDAKEQDRFERAVNQGLRAMPAWGAILQPADVQSLWLYVSAGR